MSAFRIRDIRVAETPDGMVELSADLGGEHCWFRVPAARGVDLRADAFVVAGLLPAMRAGLPLVVDDPAPVCPVLLANLQEIQEIFRLWGPAFGQPFQRVEIHAPVAAAPPGRESAVFFSGGVDGTYTLLETPERADAAAFVRGVDFQLDNPVYDESFARNAAWLAARDIPLLPMSSNLRWVARAHGLGWRTFFGPGLAAFAHVYGFRCTWLASGHSWKDLFIEGSHPCSDHLWSSETRAVRHHGRAALRWEKIARIANEPGALEILRVCWQDKGFNCGTCEKCLRTRVVLRLLGLSTSTLPALTDLSMVADFMPADDGEAVFIQESIDLAIDRNDAALQRALEHSLWRYRLTGLARSMDQLLLGGRIHRWRTRSQRG
jgi:hypothetical protein